MDKKQLQAALKAAVEKCEALLAKSDWTDADDDAYKLAETEATEHKAALDALAEREKVNAERASRLKDFRAASNQPLPRVTKPQAPGSPAITKQHLAAEDDPNGGFKTPREFLVAVMDAGKGHGRCDERLLPLRAAAGSDEHGEYADAYGNYLVPTGLVPGLNKMPTEGDPTAPLCSSMPMTSPSIKWNARTDKDHTSSVSGGLRVYRRQETGDVPESRMQIEQVTFTAHSLMGVSYATEEILQDSPISFAAMIQEGFNDEFAAKLLDEKLRGSGVGEFEGVLKCPATIPIPKETGQAAATIVLENLVKMAARCWGIGQVWLATHDAIPALASLSFVAGTGGTPFWWGSAREGFPAQLLGKPIYFTEFCEPLGTVGDIILADWGEYTVATLEGVKSAESMHVRFLNHERTFKFWTRNDGRSLWRAPLTPKKGATKSPFITLATRA